METKLKKLYKIAKQSALVCFFSYLIIVICFCLVLIGAFAYKKAFVQNPFYFVAIVFAVLALISVYLFSYLSRKKAYLLVDDLENLTNDFVDELEKLFYGPLGTWIRILKKIKTIFDYANNLTASELAELDNSNHLNSENKDKKSCEVLLESQRLILRHFEKQDLETVYNYRNDFSCAQYQTYSCFTKDEITNMFAINKNCNFYSDQAIFAIALKESNTIIGEVYVSNKSDSKEYFIGFTIKPECQRKGYAFEIVSELLVYLATTLKDYAFYCTVFEKNIKSKNLIEKLEFKKTSSFMADRGKVLVYKKTYN
ncbi:MAG: GNAT family N-acetyltransferase [Malacoplasma sp.]|nr:GNAT family N-acetyltransferase [Malacoplasma sp.]